MIIFGNSPHNKLKAIQKCLKTRRSGRWFPRARGQTTVEISLIILPFMLLFFAITDFAQFYFFHAALQNGLREAARFASAGSVIQLTNAQGVPLTTNNSSLATTVPVPIPMPGHSWASRNYCIKVTFANNCVLNMNGPNGLPTNIVIHSCQAPSDGSLPPIVPDANGNATLNTNLSINPTYTNGPGYEGDYEQISADWPIQMITPIGSFLGGFDRKTGSYLVHVSIIFKNEPAQINFEGETNLYSEETEP